jgi:hypothetical protein
MAAGQAAGRAGQRARTWSWASQLAGGVRVNPVIHLLAWCTPRGGVGEGTDAPGLQGRLRRLSGVPGGVSCTTCTR